MNSNQAAAQERLRRKLETALNGEPKVVIMSVALAISIGHALELNVSKEGYLETIGKSWDQLIVQIQQEKAKIAKP